VKICEPNKHEWGEEQLAAPMGVVFARWYQCKNCPAQKIVNYCEGRIGGDWRIVIPKK
jgi:hypothetical protein